MKTSYYDLELVTDYKSVKLDQTLINSTIELYDIETGKYFEYIVIGYDSKGNGKHLLENNSKFEPNKWVNLTFTNLQNKYLRIIEKKEVNNHIFTI